MANALMGSGTLKVPRGGEGIGGEGRRGGRGSRGGVATAGVAGNPRAKSATF